MNKKNLYGQLELENILYVSDGDKPFVVIALANQHTIVLSKKSVFKSNDGKTFSFLINPSWEYEVRIGDRENFTKTTYTGLALFDKFIKGKCERKAVKAYEKL